MFSAPNANAALSREAATLTSTALGPVCAVLDISSLSQLYSDVSEAE